MEPDKDVEHVPLRGGSRSAAPAAAAPAAVAVVAAAALCAAMFRAPLVPAEAPPVAEIPALAAPAPVSRSAPAPAETHVALARQTAVQSAAAADPWASPAAGMGSETRLLEERRRAVSTIDYREVPIETAADDSTPPPARPRDWRQPATGSRLLSPDAANAIGGAVSAAPSETPEAEPVPDPSDWRSRRRTGAPADWKKAPNPALEAERAWADPLAEARARALASAPLPKRLVPRAKPSVFTAGLAGLRTRPEPQASGQECLDCGSAAQVAAIDAGQAGRASGKGGGLSGADPRLGKAGLCSAPDGRPAGRAEYVGPCDVGYLYRYTNTSGRAIPASWGLVGSSGQVWRLGKVAPGQTVEFKSPSPLTDTAFKAY